ncbi:MAG: glycoside hydrolase family 2 TIM barrel-domain containing protein, partial [Candidatus Glassbacteria bacterium]
MAVSLVSCGKSGNDNRRSEPLAGKPVPLRAQWTFRLDPEDQGASLGWHSPESLAEGWEKVTVPHTWQIADDSAEYMGVAWYRGVFEAPTAWNDLVVRLEFEAVYHSAMAWLNGIPVGEHLRKGYTAFTLDVTSALRPGQENLLAVRVDNSFDRKMLPRGSSYDWTPDGGIIRPVNLIVTPRTFIERIDVDALPDLESAKAKLELCFVLQNKDKRAASLEIGYRVEEEDTGKTVLRREKAATASLEAGQAGEIRLPADSFANPRLWHFDHPNLYRLVGQISCNGEPLHRLKVIFGVRSFEVKDRGFYLNGERVRLMGVERMGGSDPVWGMAEPAGLIQRDHDLLKELNCVFTRVHWQQDRRVLDYCDRHGILIQVEVPTWGPDTFEGMQDEPDPEIMQNALEQLRELIGRDRNHPSVFAWGLCNEIGGQNPPAYRFAERLYQEASR